MIACARCYTRLDDDAPGGSCAVCLGQMPSPPMSRFAMVCLTAASIAEAEGRAPTPADMLLASAVHRSEVQA